MWIATFRLHTASLHQATRSTGYSKPYKLLCSAQRTARIEMHQSQLLKTSQWRQNIVIYKVSRNQWTSSPDEDCTTSRFASQVTTSWDKRSYFIIITVPRWKTAIFFHDVAYYSSQELFYRIVVLQVICLCFWESEPQFTVIIFLFFYRTLIIENFIPPDERVKLTNRASYDEENEEWKLKPSSQNGRWWTLCLLFFSSKCIEQ